MIPIRRGNNKNGELLAAAREERFDRIKFSDSYPFRAVEYCLKTAGVTLKDIDHVAFAWNPGHEIEPLDSSRQCVTIKHLLHYVPNNLLRHIQGDKRNKRSRILISRWVFQKAVLTFILSRIILPRCQRFFRFSFEKALYLR